MWTVAQKAPATPIIEKINIHCFEPCFTIETETMRDFKQWTVKHVIDSKSGS